MPRVFRVMKKSDDGLPVVEQSAGGLGVRPGNDVDVDDQHNVVVNGKGMSVSPSWRDIPRFRIPKRLHEKFPGARGSDHCFCFRMGEGPFQESEFAPGLDLVPDSPTHGCIAPRQYVSLGQYVSDLADTRPNWQEDEN